MSRVLFRFLARVVGIVVFALVFISFSQARNAPAKPVVIVFPVGVQAIAQPDKAKNVTKDDVNKDSKKDQKQEIRDEDRVLVAARLFRDQLLASGVVESVLYSPESSIFIRAMQENKITVARPDEPDAAERLALTKAIGAQFSATIKVVSLPEDNGGNIRSISIALEATDVTNRKVFTDESRAQAETGSILRPLDTPAMNAYRSAANTLAVRFLARPLSGVTRTTPDPAMLPDKPAVKAPETTETRPEVQADIIQKQGEALLRSGDTASAIIAFRRILQTQPNAHWARIALAATLLNDGKSKEAEAEYRTVLQAESTNKEAAAGLARVRAAEGDFEGALSELGGTDPAQRYTIAASLFDEISGRTAALMIQNRQAWEGGKLSREAFYKASKSQSERANRLLKMVQDNPAPANADPAIAKVAKRRILAASLLVQASTSLITFLESGDTNAGAQVNTLLEEFRFEWEQVLASTRER